MIPQCLDQGVGIVPWSPLARGLLAGTVTPSGEQRTTRARTDPFLHSLYRPDLDLPVIERAAEIAARRGVSTAQVALSWLLHKPGVTAPIAGATRRSRASRSPTCRILCRGSSSSRIRPSRPFRALGHRRPLRSGPDPSAWQRLAQRRLPSTSTSSPRHHLATEDALRPDYRYECCRSQRMAMEPHTGGR